MTRHSTDIIGELRNEHEHLYTKLLDYQASDKVGVDAGKEHEKLAKAVNSLLDKLETITPDVRLLNDYTWLINASLQWQAFAASLDIQ